MRTVALIAMAIAAWLFWQKKRGGLPTPNEIDCLARVLIVEARHVPDDDPGLSEWYAIGWVARNRAALWGASICDVVYNRRPARTWNTDTNWNKFMADASKHKYFDKAKTTAAVILSGVSANPIGDRINFWHPSGMVPRGRVPTWGRKAVADGTALNIGRAVFVKPA